jgi:hypothetical protein
VILGEEEGDSVRIYLLTWTLRTILRRIRVL